MLVLSRKPGERIRIGDDIYIVVGRITGGKVKLRFEAPLDVPIVRTELDPPIYPAPETEVEGDG